VELKCQSSIYLHGVHRTTLHLACSSPFEVFCKALCSSARYTSQRLCVNCESKKITVGGCLLRDFPTRVSADTYQHYRRTCRLFHRYTEMTILHWKRRHALPSFLTYFVNLYMFRAYLGPSSGGRTLCIQHSVDSSCNVMSHGDALEGK